MKIARSSRRRRAAFALAAGALGIVLVLVAWTLVHGILLYRDVTALVAIASEPDDPTPKVAALVGHVRAARQEVDALRPVLDPLASVAGWASTVPIVGRPL